MVLAYVATGVNIFSSLVIILADIVVLCMFCMRHRKYQMESLQRRFQAARDAAVYARSPAVAIFLLAKQVGMSEEEILAEYEKESGERKMIVESVLGKEDKDELCKFFLRNYMSRFMQYGYAEEAVIVNALRQKVEEQKKAAAAQA